MQWRRLLRGSSRWRCRLAECCSLTTVYCKTVRGGMGVLSVELESGP